ncbi:parkin coregulated gene protein-like [Armigeres subalbatus]|uniref:parkin coregulated gene protein-like n=1 Tax=Armigeres subalbatus TaxID=124917 RepID=UPI002ED3D927
MCHCPTVCCQYRPVPPFSYQSLQCGTIVYGPPRIAIYRRQWPPCRSLFRKFFLRGDIPIRRNYKNLTPRPRRFIEWVVKPELLDYQRYLPLFFDGLCESTFPYREFARNGVRDMIAVAKERQLLCCLPMLILPAKRALNTKDPDVIIATLRALQQLVQAGPWVGLALVPYYRQLLPILNLFRDFNVNIGDRIDFQGGHRLGDVINETLQVLERHGGPDAYLNIKYMVPTYESCVLNK